MHNSTEGQSDGKPYRSILSTLLGSLLRQTADASTSIMLGLYLSYVDAHVHPVSALQVGLVAVGFNATTLLFGPVFGALSDLRGRKIFMVLGPLIGAVVVQIYPLTVALPVIALALVLEGLTGAFETPSAVGFLADTTPDASVLRGRAMALFEIISAVGTASGYLVGGILWDTIGRGAFRVLSIVYMCGALTFLLGVQEDFKPARQARRTLRHYGALLASREVWSFSPAWIVMVSITTAWLSQVPFQLSRELTVGGQSLMGGFSGTVISITLLIVGITLTVGMYIWGSISARFDKVSIMLLSMIGVYGFCIALYLLNHVDLTSASLVRLPVVSAFLLLLAAIFITSGFTPVALAYLSGISDKTSSDRGIVMGMYLGVLLGGGRILGSWLAGVFADWQGIDGMILLTAALTSLGLMNIVWIKVRPLRERTRSQPPLGMRKE